MLHACWALVPNTSDERYDVKLNEDYVYITNIFAQSSTVDKVVVQGDHDVTKVTHDVERTTAFVEDTKVIKGEFFGKGTANLLEDKFSSVKDFLAKPYLVSSNTWTTSQPIKDLIYYNDPATFLIPGNVNEVPAWTNKLKGFNLVKGTFHYRVELTANRFQNGMLVMHYIPCANDLGSLASDANRIHNATMNGILQQPHLLINASDSSAEFTIPYIAPSSHFSLDHFTYTWGAMFLHVLAPLRTGAGGENFVRINTYAWLDDVELAAPIVPQSNTEDRSGPISSGLNTATSTLTKAGPIVNKAINSVTWVTRTLSNLASSFGWSKPTNTQQTDIVARQQWRYGATAEGADNSIPLSLLHDNRLDVDNYSIRGVDEMSMDFLLSVANYVGSVQWNTTQASNTTIYNQALTPSALGQFGSTTLGGHTVTWAQYAPIGYLCQFFNFWRGSFTLKLKIIKTEMHKGRLQITWTPSDSPTTLPGLSDSVYSLRHIVDLAQKDTIELNLPYLMNIPWLNTHTEPYEVSPGKSSGVLKIDILNELRAPETCSPTVDVLMWIEAGPDFEFAAPGAKTALANLTTLPFVPQASVEDRTDTLVQDGIGGSQIRNKIINPAMTCFGEAVTSMKQLMNRFSRVYLHAGWYGNSGQIAIWPWFTGEYTLDTDGLVHPYGTGDVLSYMLPCYAYARGSIRIGISPFTSEGIPVPSMSVNLSPFTGPYNVMGTPTANTGSPLLGFDAVNAANIIGPAVTETDYGLGLTSVVVPYYCRTPITTTLTNQRIVPYERAHTPVNIVNFQSHGGVDLTGSTVYRSTCDDFQLSFFVGCPPIMTSYV